MKVTAISDLHGYLPDIEPTDLLLIAGDWSPLEIQNKIFCMREWIADILVPWFNSIQAEKIVFIAGNHDFICDERVVAFIDKPNFEKDLLNPLLRKYKLLKKVKYLCNSYTKYKGIKIYGCPFVEGCRGWAFSHPYVEVIYNDIPKCDILLTHQPPMYRGVGKISIDGIEAELGSWTLYEVLQRVRPNYMFCGHIHNGDHNPQVLHHSDIKKTVIQNCSIKDEDYLPTHPIITMEISSIKE